MSNGERPKIYPTDPGDPGDASPYIGRIRGGGDSPWSAAQDPPRTDKRTEPTRREAAGKRRILDTDGRTLTNEHTEKTTSDLTPEERRRIAHEGVTAARAAFPRPKTYGQETIRLAREAVRARYEETQGEPKDPWSKVYSGDE